MPPRPLPGFPYNFVKAAAAGWLLFGCSEPRFSEPEDGGCDAACTLRIPDGGEPSEDADSPPQDTGTPEADAGRPAWQQQIVGHYAMRSHIFAFDGIVWVRSDELNLAEFVYTDDGVELRYRACESKSYSFTITGTTEVLHPEAMPEVRLPVSFDGGEWSTLPTSSLFGYSEDPLVPCTPGEAAPRAPEQKWLASTCMCPSTTNVPTSPNDCRVQDIDGDGEPGITFHVDTTIVGDFYVVGDKRDRFINGSLDEGGAHAAKVVGDGTSTLLGCTTTPCRLVEPSYCNPAGNSAVFVRLDELTPPAGGWDCEALKAQRDDLFLVPLPRTPESC